MPTKRERVREMFGRVAARYDRLNSLLSFGQHHRWRRIAVRHCRFPRGGLALDVGAGTGDFALETIGEHGRAVAVDPCAPMLAAGLPKIRARAPGRVQLVVGEAEHLPVASDRFDCATTGFVLRNVTDVQATFCEMARAVKPGGRVVALEIARPRHALFAPIFACYFYRLSPWLARLFGGDPDAYRYLPHSVKEFHTREELAEMMRRAGLVDVYWVDLNFGSITLHVGTKPPASDTSSA